MRACGGPSGGHHGLCRQPASVRSGTSRNYPGFNGFLFRLRGARALCRTTRGAIIDANGTLLDRLCQDSAWQSFLAYKTSLACPKSYEKELRAYIDARAYLPVCEAIASGKPFPLPRKAEISKMGSRKVRTVYIYPEPENTALKLLTHLLLRRYDGLFGEGLYSFRPGRAAKDAIRALMRVPGAKDMHAYKVDISNYFNSIPLEAFLPKLREACADDPALCAFLTRLLEEPCVLDGGRPVAEQKGIMAGTPLSAFYANLYLRELDAHFEAARIPYARYSDDIIVLAPSEREAREHAAFIRSYLRDAGLAVNPAKENFYTPESGWSFLGFSYRQGTVDIAPATFAKLKAKMRRKTRALARWQKRNGEEPERAARAFIRVFNRKLLESPQADNELSWKGWFFPVINTTATLHEIDAYAQDCIRCLVSGTRTKARFNVRYDELKRLGYRNLVHAYYEGTKTQER